MDTPKPLTEKELQECRDRLDLQCQAHNERAADLDARDNLLRSRLDHASAHQQRLVEGETKLRERESACSRKEITLEERELAIKERELALERDMETDISREREAEWERRLRELEEREREASELFQKARDLQSERLEKRERDLNDREQALAERERQLISDLEELNEKGSELEEQERALQATTESLRDWARELSETKPAPKKLSAVESLKEEIAQLKGNSASKPATVESTHNAPITIKDALAYVPNFEGSSATVSDFIRSCKRACSMLPASAEFMFLTLLRQKFKGEARTSVENMDYANMKEFDNLMRSVFDRRRSANQYKADMENIVMKPDEKMVSYVNRARTIYRDILHAETAERGELSERETLKIDKDAISAFLNGIPPLLQMQCKLKPHENLEQTYASAIEAFKDHELNTKRFKEQLSTPLTTRPSAAVAVIRNATNNNVNAGSQGKASGRNNKNNLVCTFCGLPRHTEDQCYRKLIPGFAEKVDSINNQNPKALNNNKRSGNFGSKNQGGTPKSGNQKSDQSGEACPCCNRTNHKLQACIKFASLIQTRFGQSGNLSLPGKNSDGSHGSPNSPKTPPKDTASPSTSRQS